MNEKKVLIAMSVVLVLAGALGAAFMAGRNAPPENAATRAAAGTEDGTRGQKHEKQLWTCGMHPWIVEEEPGQCPICGMDLVPKTDTGDRNRESGIRIDPETVQNMGVRTAVAKKAPLVRTIRTWGHVTYDETRVHRLSPKVAGWVEEARVDYPGAVVGKGDVLARIYSPALLTAQEEYLAASGALKDAARRRLLYWDVPESFVERLARTGKVEKTVPLTAPAAGVVTVTRAKAGAAVRPGTILYEISDISRVWVEAHVFAYELPWVRTGQKAVVTLPYVPGQRFTGRVSYVYPYVREKARDVVVRLEFDNPDLILKPEMYADVEIESNAGREAVLVPSEAVLRTGDRDLVFIAADKGRFVPRRVTTGVSAGNGMVEIRSGVRAGETVVVSGQFLLDSESRLEEAAAKMLAPERKPAPAPKKDAAAKEDDFFADM